MTAKIYDLSARTVALTSLVYMLLSGPVILPASYVLEKWGNYTGTAVAAAAILLGSWLKTFISCHFGFVLAGQCFLGLANPFVISQISKVSANWFAASDRALVTNLLSLASITTAMLGTLYPGLWFLHYDEKGDEPSFDGGKLSTYYLCLSQAIVTTLLVIPCLFFYQDKPPSPPCLHCPEERENYWKSLVELLTNRAYLGLMLAFSFLYGGFLMILVILPFILEPFNITDTSLISGMSVASTLSGILGCLLGIIFLKRTQNYRVYLIALQLGMLVGMGVFYIALGDGGSLAILLSSMLIGFFMIPLIPGLLELACEISFPVSEVSTAGFLLAPALEFAAVLGLIVAPIAEQKTKESS